MALLRGRVRSGFGKFSYVLENVEGLWDVYRKKSGLKLFPGSLNLELAQEFSIPAGSTRILAGEYDGPVNSRFYPCTIKDLPGIIIRTDAVEAGTGDHPRTIIDDWG